MTTAREQVALTTEEVVEDAAYLAASGVGMRETARRMGTTVDALERRLYRAGQHELVSRLRGQDPMWPQAHEVTVGRYGAWARSIEGRTVLADARRWLDLVRATWPDTPEDQGRRQRALVDDLERRAA